MPMELIPVPARTTLNIFILPIALFLPEKLFASTILPTIKWNDAREKKIPM